VAGEAYASETQHRSRGRVGTQWVARRMAGCQITGGREVLRQVEDDTAPPREISIPSIVSLVQTDGLYSIRHLPKQLHT